MLGTALASALVASLLTKIGEKSIEKAAEGVVATTVSRTKNTIEKKLKKGDYAPIERALNDARDDLLAQCRDEDQRRRVNSILEGLLNSQSSVLLDEFSQQVTQAYLRPSPEPTDALILAQMYRKIAGPAALIKGELPHEDDLAKLLSAFFEAFRERLLREKDFTYLREYFQLTEARQQTDIQQEMCDLLEAIAANTARDVEVVDDSALSREYRSYLIAEYKDHIIRGFAPQVGGRVLALPLSEIFLPLQAIEGRPAVAQYAEEDLRRQVESEFRSEFDWQRRREEMEKRYAQLSARQAAQRTLTLADLLRSARAVLLGDPGAGKSTVTRYIAYALAAGDFTHTGTEVGDLTPVLVRIANYARAYERGDGTLHLIEYIERELFPRPEFGSYIQRMIKQGKALVILDGLDEVTDPSLRMQITEHIQATVSSFSANRYLVTSRIVGYDLSPLTREFTHATLQDLTTADQRRFVQLWYAAIRSHVSESTSAAGADDLIAALQNKPQIARIAANPLLLTIVVLMHWRGVKLPSRRVQVYENATDTLVEYWTQQRGVDMDAEEIKQILAPIAHYILSSNVGGVIGHLDLLPRFFNGIVEQRGCNQNEARRIGKDLLGDLNEQSGLFLERGRDASNQPVYGFLHQTFGEYLAALCLAQQMLSGNFQLGDYIHRSVWYEPLLLTTGHLALVSPVHTDQLIRQILDFEAPYEEVLQRNLLLTADCLGDDVQVKPHLRDEILSRLAKLLCNEAPQLQSAALERFQRLASTRYREPALALLKNIYVLDSADASSQLSEQAQLSLATALVYLGDRATAQPIIWRLTDDKNTDYASVRQLAQRLRFEHWPEQAADFLLQLLADQRDRFAVSVGSDLASSTIGIVDAGLARRVLGETGYALLIHRLTEQMPEQVSQARLRWLAVLGQDQTDLQKVADLTLADIPAEVRCLAATRLLKTTQQVIGIAALRELLMTASEQAPAAAQALMNIGEAIQIDWNLIRDTALMANNATAPQAIVTLLQSGDRVTTLPAALHVLATGRASEVGTVGDRRLWRVTAALIEDGYMEVGLAAAYWLALCPGYERRINACEALLEAGKVDRVIPLLEMLAYDSHDEPSRRACQHLLSLRESDRVVPLLVEEASTTDAEVRYQACLALALANPQSNEPQRPSYSRLDRMIALHSTQFELYRSAIQDLCHAGMAALEKLAPQDQREIATVILGKVSMDWLVGLSVSETDIKALYESNIPALQVNAAYFDLRRGLVEHPRALLTELLSKTIKEISIPITLEALSLLELVSNERQIDLFVRLLANPVSAIRKSAIDTFGHFGDAQAVAPLLTLLANDTDDEVRSSASEALRWISDPQAISFLLTAAINDTDSRVRVNAAQALGWIGDPQAVHPLFPVLIEDTDSRVRVNAAQALGWIGDPQAVPSLLAALTNDTDSSVRSRAAQALGWIGDPQAVPSLLAALTNDTDSSVRSRAAQALGLISDPQAVQPLLAALANDTDSSVRGGAAYALGQIGDPLALQPLLAALADTDSSVREGTARAIGQIGNPQAVATLLAALTDTDRWTRESAAQALARIDGTAAINMISAISGTTFEYKAELLIHTLIHLAPAEAISLLDTYARKLRRRSWLLRLRGHAFTRLGDRAAALTSFKEAIEQQETSDNLLALAHLHLENGELAEARMYADQAVKLAPKGAISLLSQAVVQWAQGEAEAAFEQLTKALRRDRRITNIKDLQFDHMWGTTSIATLQELLAAMEK